MSAAGDRVLSDDRLEFLRRRLMVSVATADADRLPALVRCVGFRIDAARDRVSLFVVARQATRLLQDLADNGRVAAVFSEPSTHRTLQLKGENAAAGPLEEGDWPAIVAYWDVAVAELGPLGYAEPWIRKIFECTPNQVRAIRFVPTSAFAQTPGPQAGARLA